VAAFPNLEELALVGFNLDNVDMSLLTKLRMLDLQEVALDNINFNGLSSLTQLELSYVKVANRFPESIGALVSLRELVMARLEMRKKGVALPNSIGNLTSLSRLAFFSCTHGDMPDSISGLVSLRNLHICVDGLARLPETFERLQSLTHLHISAAEIQLPNSLSKLTQLKSFQLHLYPVHLAFLVDPPPGDMEAMAALLAPIPQLRSLGALRLDLPGPVTIPADITNLDRLTRLEYKSPLGASKAPSVFFELITLRCLEIVTSEPDLQPPTHEIFKLRKLRKLTIPHQWKGTMKLKRGLPLLTKIEYVYHKFHTWL
jgi:hypothetical protein